MRIMKTPVLIIVFMYTLFMITGQMAMGESDSKDIVRRLPGKTWAIGGSGEQVVMYLIEEGPKAETVSEVLIGKLAWVVKRDVTGVVSWVPLGRIFHLVPMCAPLKMAVGYSQSVDKTLIVVSMEGGGAPVFKFGWISRLDVGQRLANIASRNKLSKSLGDLIDWEILGQLDYRGAKPGWFLSDFRSPYVAGFRNEVFVAGQSAYPGETQYDGVWVGNVESIEGRKMKGVLLGKARAPALIGLKDRMYCFAIEPTKWLPAKRDEEPGRVIGWMSNDGVEWKSVDVGIAEPNMVRVDGCAYGDGGFVACLCKTAKPSIRVFKFEEGIETIREVQSFGVGDVGSVANALAVRAVGDDVFVFWEERDAEGRLLLSRKAELSGVIGKKRNVSVGLIVVVIGVIGVTIAGLISRRSRKGI